MSIKQQSCVEAMKQIADIAEGSTTANSLQHIAKIARQAIAEAAVAEQHKKHEVSQEPLLVVEKEPDYMSGGHFHTGTKPHIDPTKVWSLPIGTKLYTSPYIGQPKDDL